MISSYPITTVHHHKTTATMPEPGKKMAPPALRSISPPTGSRIFSESQGTRESRWNRHVVKMMWKLFLPRNDDFDECNVQKDRKKYDPATSPLEDVTEDVGKQLPLQSIVQDFKRARNYFEPGAQSADKYLKASDFRLTRFIGEGSFGNVIQACVKNRRSFAVKVLDRDEPSSLNELQVV